MDVATFAARLTGWAFGGAAVGLLVGLLLLALGVVDNPFWSAAAGILAAAVAMPLVPRRGAGPGPLNRRVDVSTRR